MRRKTNFSDCDLLYDGAMKFGGLGWREYIKKTGKETWTVWYDPLDKEYAYLYCKDVFPLKDLITYVLERDIWLDGMDESPPSIALTATDREYFAHTNESGLLGAHMNGLLNHLDKQGFDNALTIAKIAAGMKWIQPDDIVDSDTIGLKVEAVSRKAIWTHVYRKAFAVGSYYRKGLIYPPFAGNLVYLFLYEDQQALSFDYKPHTIKLSKRCLGEMEEAQVKSLRRSVLLHIPHASTYIPEEQRSNILLDDDQLKEELLCMTDRYVDELFHVPGYEMVVAPVSRLVCDVERFTEDAQESMAKKGMGVIYTKTHDGKQLRKECSAAQEAQLVRLYHAQNSLQLRRMVEDSLRDNGTALILDCHSFSSNPLPCDEDQTVPRPDICLGTDALHTPPALLDWVRRFFASRGYSIGINTPFAGCYIPEGMYRISNNVLAIMVEINRSRYMDEATGEKLPSFSLLQNQMKEFVEVLSSFQVKTWLDARDTKTAEKHLQR
jgi:N-formylglutamate amidohydrolase